MGKKQFCIFLAVALIGGLIGGFLSGKVFTNNTAFAQGDKKPKIIEANEFRVVDKEGKIISTLGILPYTHGVGGLRFYNKENVVNVALSTFGLIQTRKDVQSILNENGLSIYGKGDKTKLELGLGLSGNSRLVNFPQKSRHG